MIHPLVDQLHFARRQLMRALEGVSEVDAQKRLLPMNCISWMVGHLAWHEQYYWVKIAQNRSLIPHLDQLVGNGRPASTPGLQDMWQAWQEVTRAADDFLETLTIEQMPTRLPYKGKPASQNIGTMLQRVIYHYWYHIGESQAIRQLLGHTDLPQFVGDIGAEAPYRSE